VIPKGLDHSVCRFGGGDAQCQSGQPGALCGQTSDCVVQTGLNHPVCREDKCQSGQPGALCGQTSDCVVQTRLDPPHAVCRNGKCQRGVHGDYCGQNKDCLSHYCRPIGTCGGSI